MDAIKVTRIGLGRLDMELPVPESSNRQSRTGRGKHYTPSEVKFYQRVVYWKLHALLDRERLPIVAHPDLVAVWVWWYRTERRGDLSRRWPIVEDALQGIAYSNDSQVQRLVLERVDTAPRDYLVVKVEAL